MWLTGSPLWCFLSISTYSISLTALERYVAVIHPVWYHNNVRTVSAMVAFQCFHIISNINIVYILAFSHYLNYRHYLVC